MLRPGFIHKKYGAVIFSIICFAFNFFLSNNSIAADSLSYSGRLVQANGAPVAGPVNLLVELSYTNAPSTILCSQSFTGVVLTNGVFHLKLDLACGANGTIANVLSSVPTNESAAIRVTDVTHSKVYSFQAMHSMPFANIATTAKQLSQMGASTGQVLIWNGSAWAPGNPGGSGTVTSVTGTLPISVATGTSTPAISISQANTTTNGYLSSADWNTFNSKQGSIAAGTALQYYRGDKTWATLDTSAVPENVANLYFTNARVLGVPLTSFAVGTGAITNTDSVISAFGKAQGQIDAINTASAKYLVKNATDSITGVVNVGTIGALNLTYTPTNLTDAVNKAYVDADDALRVAKAGDTMSGALALDGSLKIKGGTNYVTINGHATSAAYNLILPQTAGTSGYVLSTDGTGNLSWINPSSVTAGTGTVTSASIVDGTIVDADVSATAAIAQSKIANLTTDLASKVSSTLANGNILIGNASNVANAHAVSGDATLDNTGVLTLKNTGTAGTYSSVTTDAQGRVTGGSNPVVVTAVSVTAPITNTGTASIPLIGMPAATTSANGYLTSTDWNTFNGKQNAISAGATINGIVYPANAAQTLQIPLAPSNPTDAVNKSYVDGLGQWTKGSGANAADIYRLTGNVGIGTTAPGANLHVIGTAAFENSTATASGPTFSFWKTRAYGADALDDELGFISFMGHDGTGLYRSAYIAGHVDAAPASATHTVQGRLSFFTTQSGASDASERMRITSAGNVGIGTITPARNLSVQSTALVVADFTTSSTAGIVDVVSTNATGSAMFRLGAANSTKGWQVGAEGSSGNFNIQAGMGATFPNPAVSILTGGNVGIGTTTPQSKLDVNGAIRVGADATACSATIAGAMRFNTPNVEYCNGTAWTAFSTPNSSITSAQIVDGTIIDADVSATAAIAQSKIANLTTDLAAKQPLDPTLTSLAAYNTNGILVQTAADTFAGRSIVGTANRLTVSNGDGVAGNPTINIPTALLPSPIAGDAGKFLKATAADTSVWTALGLSDITTALGYTPVNKAGDSVTAGTLAFSGTAALTVQNPVNLLDAANKQYVDGFGQWTKGTGANAADIYRASGNVGIGTTAPFLPLDVHGGAAFHSGTSDAWTGAAVYGTQFGALTNDSTSYYLQARANGGAAVFSIRGDGNVGIGTTTPGYNLDVTSSTNIASMFRVNSANGTAGIGNINLKNNNATNGNSNSVMAFNSTGAASAWMDFINVNHNATGTQSGAISFSTENSGAYAQRMYIDPAGNVGIGTTAPSSKLHVAASDNSAWAAQIINNGTTNAHGLMAQIGTSSTGVPFGVYKGAAEYMRVDNAGNVGIGTTTPAEKLNVVGTIRSEWDISNSPRPGLEVRRVTSGVFDGSQFTVDVGMGAGLTNLVGGAILNSAGTGYNYLGTRGAAGINLGDGTIALTVGGTTGTAGNPVTFTTGLYMDSASRVGIGTTVPSYTLHVVGTAGLSTGTAWTNASDIRLKDIHGDYEYGLNEILKLHTVRYSYKKDNPLKLPSDFSKTGFIAQEVQKVIPDAVKKREDGYLELNVDPIHWAVVNSIKDLYSKYILPLWESDKKQAREIASLKESNENLKKENAEIKARLDRIEKALKSK